MTNQGGLPWAIKVFLILSISLGFFCTRMAFKHEYAHANETTIVINEIAWMGTTVSANDEWIELYNLTTQAVDLTGWTLAATDGQPKINLTGSISAGGYFLLERTSDQTVPGIIADQIYTGALGNSGEILELRDGSNNLVDKIDVAAGWPAGDNTTKATMERKADGSWQTSQISGGSPKAQSSGGIQLAIPVCGNGQQETGEQCDDGNLVSGDGCSSTCQQEAPATTTPLASPQPSPYQGEGVGRFNLGDVVINELVSDPADNEVEWVELYNRTSNVINLTGWTITEGSGAKTEITGNLSSSDNGRFLVIEKPKGNLNNNGDIVILRDGQDNLIDQVTYGNWDDGNKEDNAPVAADPNSIARLINGQNSFNNKEDFTVTIQPTKGSSNIIKLVVQEEEVSPEAAKEYDYSNNIVISEIFPNPVGLDNNQEFIELYNKGSQAVNLLGWSLSDLDGKKVLIEKGATSTLIQAKDYLVLWRSQTKIVLNNDRDAVRLFQPLKENPIQIVKYSKPPEGWSYSIGESCFTSSTDCDWQWSEIVTPGQTNIMKIINHPPRVEFIYPEVIVASQPVIFDSSDTTDEDGDELKFNWDFGDGIINNLANPQHTFLKIGTYTVKLAVNDGKEDVKKEKIIKVFNSVAEAMAESNLITNSTQVLGMSNINGVVLNEILPNPAGDDTAGEWIELKNQGDEKINLLNWKVENSSQKFYSFANDLWLGDGQFYLFNRSESKLVLNNQADIIRLFNDLGELVDSADYQNASEGEAYARGQNNKWFWTTVLTPGLENIIEVAQSRGIIKNNQTQTKTSTKIYTEITLDKVKEYEAGDLVKVKGTVAVEPGVLGTQIFYIVGSAALTPELFSASSSQEKKVIEETTTGGIQIYNYKKDFPTLRVGDYIEVSGELALSADELRIKTGDKADIKVIDHGSIPQPQVATCDKIDEESVGQLISISGEVTERKSSTIYLDDGTDEVMVYVKSLTGIDPKSFTPGDRLIVSGILSKTNTGLRLLPRYVEDLVRVNVVNAAEPQVLGEVAVADQWQLEARDKKLELFKYLLIIAAGVIVVLVGLMIKNRKNKKIV